MEEFNRALEVDRKDLLFSTNKKKKRTVVAPLVITFSPANPNFKEWIAQELPILHEESKLKKLIPKIDVVTRQAPNIAQKTIRSRHWKTKSDDGPPPLPPGNYKLHN